MSQSFNLIPFADGRFDARPVDNWSPATSPRRTRFKAAYIGVLLFTLVAIARPEDWVPGTAAIPFAKITAGMAFIAFCAALQGMGKLYLPREMWIYTALLAWMCFVIPFSTWRGGSFQLVVLGYSKGVIVMLLLLQTINTLTRLRVLVFLHVLLLTLIAISSLLTSPQVDGQRLQGAISGPFGNSNDLALNLAIVVPLCIFFLWSTRNPVKKLLWTGALVVMVYTIIQTYSRSSFLALSAGLLVSIWYLGIRERRYPVILLAVVVGLLVIAVRPAGYDTRLQSILDSSLDTGRTSQARQDLLWRSIDITLKHPFVGVGPGQFPEYSGTWHVTHNAYTEFSAEAGLTGGILFCWLLGQAFVHAGAVYRRTAARSELKLLAAVLRASFAALIVGAFFDSCEYQFPPYLLIAYACVAARLIDDGATNDAGKSGANTVNRVEHAAKSSMRTPLEGLDSGRHSCAE